MANSKKRIKKQQSGKSKRFDSKSENSDKKSTQTQKPIFSLEYLQSSFCLTDCSKEQKAAFAEKLYELSQMTWSQIAVAPRHGLGSETISQSSIKAKIPPHLSEDVNLLAFRFSSKAPMVGYREGRIFHVLWLDRSFTLYDHG